MIFLSGLYGRFWLYSDLAFSYSKLVGCFALGSCYACGWVELVLILKSKPGQVLVWPTTAGTPLASLKYRHVSWLSLQIFWEFGVVAVSDSLQAHNAISLSNVRRYLKFKSFVCEIKFSDSLYQNKESRPYSIDTLSTIHFSPKLVLKHNLFGWHSGLGYYGIWILFFKDWHKLRKKQDPPLSLSRKGGLTRYDHILYIHVLYICQTTSLQVVKSIQLQ